MSWYSGEEKYYFPKLTVINNIFSPYPPQYHKVIYDGIKLHSRRLFRLDGVATTSHI